MMSERWMMRLKEQAIIRNEGVASTGQVKDMGPIFLV